MIAAPVFCPQFIGREAELGLLVERRRSASKGHGGIVLVGGDAGIGKSRLVREFLNVTGHSRGRVAVGRCRPFASTPYGPLTELLATFAPAAAALTPAQTRDAQLAALADAFLAAAAKHAIVGVIEDLHWSDSGTLAVLALLAERLATSRMLFAATYRANELGPRHPHYQAFSALLRSRCVTNVALGPLGAREVRDFIDATLQSGPTGVPRDTQRQVARIAEGNPFFTEELLKNAVDRATVHRTDRSLPTTVHAAILERIAPLGAADRAILTHAAVIGRRFDAGVLARTLDTDEAAILPALQQARTLQIVEELEEPAAFRFRHALTREAIYNELLAAQRRPLHRRIALVLETQPSQPLDALAYHWWAAGDRAKALEYGERGGDHAQALHAYPDSLECYERTLSLLERDDADAARVLAKMGTSYFRSGLMDSAIEHYRQAWTYFRSSSDDAPFIFRLARNLAAALYNDGRIRESVVFWHDGLAVIDRCGDRRISGRARLTVASYLVENGQGTAARSTLAQIDPKFIDEDLGSAIMFWLTSAQVCSLEGDVEGVRSAADRICAIEDHPADASALIDGLSDSGLCALRIGETVLARRCLQRAIEACQAIKSTAMIHGDKLCASALERVYSGAFDEARSLIVQALPMIGEVRISRHVAVQAALAAGIALGDSALLSLEPDAETLDHAFATGSPMLYGPLAAYCAQLQAVRGDSGSARRLLRRAVEAAAAALPLNGSFPLAIVAAEHGAPDHADAIETFCVRSSAGGPASLAAAQLARAILARRFGTAAAAVTLAETAAAGFAGIGWPLYEALACEIAGDRGSAEAIRARIGYRALQSAAVGQAESALEAQLTPREAEVARLVARGGTNREIALRMSVSVKLVEKVLSSVYAKLAVASRSRLTAYVLANDADAARDADSKT